MTETAKNTRANTTIPDKEYNDFLIKDNFPVAKRVKVDTVTFKQDLSKGTSGPKKDYYATLSDATKLMHTQLESLIKGTNSKYEDLIQENDDNLLLNTLKGQLPFQEGDDKIKALFDDMDSNEDGSISLSELLTHLRIKDSNEKMKVSAKKFFQSLDLNQDDSISLDEFRKGLTEDRSPRHLLYKQLTTILDPELKNGKVSYSDLSELVKALTSKTTKNAALMKNSKDTLFNEISKHPEITDNQKQYLDSLNDKSTDELLTEQNFLDIACQYCDHLFSRAANLASDNEDCILKDYLKFKTGEFEEESKKRKLVHLK